MSAEYITESLADAVADVVTAIVPLHPEMPPRTEKESPQEASHRPTGQREVRTIRHGHTHGLSS